VADSREARGSKELIESHIMNGVGFVSGRRHPNQQRLPSRAFSFRVCLPRLPAAGEACTMRARGHVAIMPANRHC
jgi:hypothetical protein